MKKSSSKKLNLSRETVRNLDSAALRGVAGGALLRSGRQVTDSCPSVQVCPSLDSPCTDDTVAK